MIYIAKCIRFLFQKDVCLYLCRNKLVCATKLTFFWVRFSLAEAITAAPFREEVFGSLMVAKKELLSPEVMANVYHSRNLNPIIINYYYLACFVLLLFLFNFVLLWGQGKIWGGCIQIKGKLSMLSADFYLCKGPTCCCAMVQCAHKGPCSMVLWYRNENILF